MSLAFSVAVHVAKGPVDFFSKWGLKIVLTNSEKMIY